MRRTAAATDDTAALAYLRALRAGHRRAQLRRTAYTAYCVLLLGGIWGVPYLTAVVRAASGGDWHGETADRVLAYLPLAAPAALVVAVVAAASRARWRGPVLLDVATAHWLLPLPVGRAAVLRPRLARAAALAGAAGVAAGAVGGLVVHALGAGRLAAAVAAGAGAGGAAAVLGVAAGTAVQRHGRVARALAAPLPLAALAAFPLLAAAGRVPAWLGAGATAVVAAGTAALAMRTWRTAPGVPARVLRRQATAALRLTAALYAFDMRLARLVVRGAGGRSSRWRLPPPRRRWLLVPWRDATALLRAPSHLGWAACWWLAALALGGWSDGVGYGMLAALVAGYLAAASLAEPARLDGDDARRAAPLPWPPGALALRHALLPAALLLAAGAPAAVWWDGRGTATLLAAVPALVAAALFSAFRGVVPARLLVGSESPLGNTGPLQALAWQLRGPLVVLGALAVPPLARFGGMGTAAAVAWTLAAGAAALAWTRYTAASAR